MANDPEAPGCWVVAWVCLLFLLACFLPCIDCGADTPPSYDFEAGWHFGVVILLLGWGGANHGVPWSANVFLVLGLLCLSRRRPLAAATFGVVASILGLSTWFLNRFSRSHDYHVLPGYFFWQASQLVLAVGAVWTSRNERQKVRRRPTNRAEAAGLIRHAAPARPIGL